MKTSSMSCLALAAALFAAGAPGAVAQDKKPNIVILATGGTIAGAAATGTQSGYTSGAVTIDAMLTAVPGIKELANVKGEQISNVGSQDMSFDIMMKLANRINELSASGAADGFVITHGTDSMVETARVLASIEGKTIVLTGALNPARFRGSDAEFNIGCAVGAVQTLPPGVYIAMNGRIWDPAKVRKNVDANRFEAAA